MTLVRRLARPLIASTFLVGGVDSIRRPAGKAEEARPMLSSVLSRFPQLPQDPTTVVRIAGAAQVVAGGTFALGILPRTSATVLATTLVPTTFAEHRFWKETDRAVRGDQRLQFLKNLSVLGGLLLAVVDTEGHPSLGYRTSKAAERARKNTARTQARASKRAHTISKKAHQTLSS